MNKINLGNRPVPNSVSNGYTQNTDTQFLLDDDGNTFARSNIGDDQFVRSNTADDQFARSHIADDQLNDGTVNKDTDIRKITEDPLYDAKGKQNIDIKNDETGDRNNDETGDRNNDETGDRNTDEDIRHSKQMESKGGEMKIQHLSCYTDLTRRLSLEEADRYAKLRNQDLGYTDLRKSMSTTDKYDVLGQHDMHTYSTIRNSTTKGEGYDAARQMNTDKYTNVRTHSKRTGNIYENLTQQNRGCYSEPNSSVRNQHLQDTVKCGIGTQISQISINNDEDYSYVRGFTKVHSKSGRKTMNVKSLSDEFNSRFIFSLGKQDSVYQCPHDKRTPNGEERSNVMTRVGLIGTAIIIIVVFVVVIILALQRKEENSSKNCTESTGPVVQTLQLAADCYQTNSTQYSGTISYTVSGRTCQNWNINYPHTPSSYPDKKEDRTTNYCRDNRDFTSGTPWCYTQDIDFRWEFCPVFKCNTCTTPPLQKPGTTVSYNITYGVVAAVYTCQSFKPGVSTPHCPISRCTSNNQWSEFNTSCSVEDRYLNSTAYRGKVACTVDGKACKIWNSDNKNLLPVDPDDHVTNYCRDPDEKGQPWCYIDVYPLKNRNSWEFCYVPKR